MVLRKRIALATAALAVAFTVPALAGPPPGGPAADKGKPKAEAHDEHGKPTASKDGDHGRPEHGDKDKPGSDKDKDKGAEGEHKGEGGGPPGLAAKDDEHHQKLLARFEERKKNRTERAKKEREEVREKLGAKLGNDSVQRELERHAKALARIERIKEIADADGKADLATRADALLVKENARHDKRLASIASPAASASGGAP